MTVHRPFVHATHPARRRTLWAGLLLGIGLAGTLDEVILHQLLHWHHFYDRSTPTVGLVSDGLFHLASTAALIAGLVLVRHDRSRSVPGWPRTFWGAVVTGAGGFDLYDGTIQHKLLRLHQVRPGVRQEAPYDIAFIGLAVVVLASGLLLLRRAWRTPQ